MKGCDICYQEMCLQCSFGLSLLINPDEDMICVQECPE